MEELLLKNHNMKALIVVILATLPSLLYAQECPVSVRKSGYIVIRQSKVDDTAALKILNGRLQYPVEPYDIIHITRFIPSDSISLERPLSYWIERGETFPSVFVLWEEWGVGKILNKRCNISFKSRDLIYRSSRPLVGINEVKLYHIKGAKDDQWYYRIYAMDAEWFFFNLSQEEKMLISFRDLMRPAIPREEQTLFFAFKKLLAYSTDINLTDSRLLEYKMK